MTRNKKFALMLVAASAIFSTALPVGAQAPGTSVVLKSKPAPAEKPIKARFEVLRMMINAIQVRSVADEREIHTFLYSDRIRDRMQALFNNGGYQYGDRVEIRYMHGSDVAVNIKGKPSRPI